MGIEIERKFLVKEEGWIALAGDGLDCRQGYISSAPDKTVRVRVMGAQAFLTIKGSTRGITRSECEYKIPLSDAESLLALCGDAVIKKKRYLIQSEGMRWEIDVFTGANAGLVVAEIELESEDQKIDLPGWLGKEISGDFRYFNSALARHPFSEWA